MANVTRYLGLRLSTNLTNDSIYNLNRIDVLGSIYTVSSDGSVRFRSKGNLLFQANDPAIGGSGSGGTVQFGSAAAPLDSVTIYATLTQFSGLGVIDEAAGGTKDLLIRYKSDITGAVDTTAHRSIYFDLEGADRQVVLGSNFRTAGGDIVLTGPADVTLPATGTLATLAGTEILTNKTINAPDNTVTNIANANVSATAGIVYSKLNLTNSLTNADIAAGAAIVYSKLTLVNSLVNADIATAAAIAYSKLNLADSIVNADVKSDAAIAGTKITPTFGAQTVYTTDKVQIKNQTINVDALATATDWTLPLEDGLAGQVLKTDGSGQFSWVSVIASPLPQYTIDVGSATNERAQVDTNSVGDALVTSTGGIALKSSSLNALKTFNTDGLLTQTAASTFTGRTITGTANRLSVSNGNGVSGNPTVNVDTSLLPSPVLADVGKILQATAADTSVWTALSSEATVASGGAVTLDNAAVIGKVLTAFSATAATSSVNTIAATDSIIDALEKAQGSDTYLNSLVKEITVDPTITAVTADQGTVLINKTLGRAWIKKDNGTSTYVKPINISDIIGSPSSSGWVTTTGISLNKATTTTANDTFRLTVTTPVKLMHSGAEYYLAAGNYDMDLTGTAAGIIHIYFTDGAGTLTYAMSDELLPFINNVPVAIVWWSGTEISTIMWELHSADRNIPDHKWKHNTVGFRYKSGLAISHLVQTDNNVDPNLDTVQYMYLSTGECYDEDILATIGTAPWGDVILGSGLTSADAANLPFYFYNGATIQRIAPMTDRTPFISSPTGPSYYDVAGTICYNNGGTIAAAATGNYVVYWVYASSILDVDTCFIRPHNAVFASLTAAQGASDASLVWVDFPAAEVKLIHRLIFRVNTGWKPVPAHGCKLVNVTDYRLASSLPVNSISATGHASLSGRTDTNQHPISAISPTTDTNKVIVGNVAGTALEESTTTATELSILNTDIAKAYTVLNFSETGVPRYDGTNAHKLAVGTTAQRPGGSAAPTETPATGMIRYNTELGLHELYRGSFWAIVGHRWASGSFSAASSPTIFTPPTVTEATCTGFEMSLRLSNSTGPSEELLNITAIKNGSIWSGSILHRGGADLAQLITIDDTTGAVGITAVTFTGTYKWRLDGFVY